MKMKKLNLPYTSPRVFMDSTGEGMSVLCTSDVNEGAGSEGIGDVVDFGDDML